MKITLDSTLEEYEAYMKENYVETYFVLNYKQIPRLTDKDGVSWYPLSYFLKKGMNTTLRAKRYANSVFEDKYMKVIIYKFKYAHSKSMTWFVNEEGLKLLLKNFKTVYSKGKNAKERTIRKDMILDEACQLFKVRRNCNNAIYRKLDYRKLHYGKWLSFVFRTDQDLRYDTPFRKCAYCHRWFPYTEKYFGVRYKRRKNGTVKLLKTYCKECNGEQFHSDNKDVERLKKLGHINYIYHYLNRDWYTLFKKAIFYDANLKLKIFNNPLIISDCIMRVREDDRFDLEDYYIQFFTSRLNIPFTKIKDELTARKFKIGKYKALPEDYAKSKRLYTLAAFKAKFRRKFKYVVQPGQLRFLPGEPIIGLITFRGLVVITKEKISLPNIKCYVLDTHKSATDRLLLNLKQTERDQMKKYKSGELVCPPKEPFPYHVFGKEDPNEKKEDEDS